MTVLNSGISWTTGTLNLVIGCTHVSDACDLCYADTLVSRGILKFRSKDFSELSFHPERLKDLRRFLPARNAAGEMEPKCVFVNSLSDFWHEKIPKKFIWDALDAFEEHPTIIFQILTKRPGRMRRLLTDRYDAGDVPENFWIGVTCEDNRVARGLDILRATKRALGQFTAFASIEPITAPCDEIDLTDIDWVLTGGESGPKARPMDVAWLDQAHDQVAWRGIPLHFKQWGRAANSPIVQRIMARTGLSAQKAFTLAVSTGEELAPSEKGGATYKGRVIQEKPRHWHALKSSLNALR